MEMREPTMTLGDRLRKLRNDRAMTQEDLSARAGLGLATVQRAERGERLSADTIASLAAAFGLDATDLTNPDAKVIDQPYLPLRVISSGRQLLAIIGTSSRLDFDFVEMDDLQQAELIERLYAFCHPLGADRVPDDPIARVKQELEAAQLLKEISTMKLVVTGGTFELTGYEIDDDCGAGQPILMGQWEETCGVIRVGTNRELVDRAYVLERLGKWETPSDGAVVYPPRPESGDGFF